MSALHELNSPEFQWRRIAIFAAATVAGLTGVIALGIINKDAAATAPSIKSFLMFAAAVALHIAASRYASHQSNAIIEVVLHRIKSRLIEKIERASLERLERIGTSEMFDRLTQNMMVVSTAASSVGGILQGISVFLFSFVYLALLSPASLLILVPLEFGAIYFFSARGRLATQLVESYSAVRIKFLDMLMALLKGAKEIKLNRLRSQEVLADFNEASAELRDMSAKTTQIFDDSTLFFGCNLYLILAALVFVLPQHIEIDNAKLSQLVAAVMFLWGSLQTGLGGYPMYVQANRAHADIRELEEKLESPAYEGSESDPWHGKPGRIAATHIEYEYPAESGEETFHIGPIDLTIEPGEILFIVGGNGAGKSTLLKVLIGLYSPTQGVLLADDIPVRPYNVAGYREMISIIFSDFHLFSRAYGILGADPAAVKELLIQMQMESKTAFIDGSFTRRDLSTGQRKRLAMVVALMEERPILVLDEWAADQDPEFRRFFYETWLPALQRRGKTVIAVSHDDRYFHCADRVVIMEYGQVREIRSTQAEQRVHPTTSAAPGLTE